MPMGANFGDVDHDGYPDIRLFENLGHGNDGISVHARQLGDYVEVLMSGR